MKKFLSILFVVITVLALTACGKFTCEQCRMESSGKKYKVEMLGQKFTVCETCNKQFEMLKGLGK